MRRAVEESEEEDEITPQQDTRRKTKKEANREARREARLARLQQVGQVREREAQNEEIREDDGIREEELEKVREEKRKLVAEEKEKKEQEEYDNWRHLISVEEAGEDVGEAEKDDPRMLQKFCAYVKREKVVVLEDLAGEFHMKTEDVVDRLTSLQEDRQLTGFFDDRGKFIYVSKGEMEDVANFIRKRGRISIQELASETTSLLHLDDPERSLSSSFASDDSNDTLS